jgi:hypothetical protein
MVRARLLPTTLAVVTHTHTHTRRFLLLLLWCISFASPCTASTSLPSYLSLFFFFADDKHVQLVRFASLSLHPSAFPPPPFHNQADTQS